MINALFYGSFRSILKQRKSTTINIIGLSLGIALFLYLVLFAKQELSIDDQHSDKVYRIENGEWALMGPGLGSLVNQAIPGIESVARVDLFGHSNATIMIGEKRINIQNFIFSDPGFFTVFNFKLIEGNKETLLNEPFSVVLTASQAKKLFGTEHSLGKTFRVDNRITYTVTGVMEDVNNSSLTIDAIGRFSDLPQIYNMPQFETLIEGMWNHPTYLSLKDGINPTEVEKKISNLIKEKYPETDYTFKLKPLKSIYFDSSIKYEMGSRHGNKNLVYLFLAVSVLILLLACANYLNLATAMAINRFKEMGIKKTLGAGKAQLIWQLVGESIIICWISLLGGLILLELISPLINPLLGCTISSTKIISSIAFVALLIGGATLLGIITGIFPALYLVKTNTINALKNEVSKGKGAVTIRASMIVFQFSIAITLIIAAFGVYSQVNFMLNKNLGFDPEDVCYVGYNRNLKKENREVLKQKLLTNPAITNVASASQVPGNITWQESFTRKEEILQYTYLAADPDLLDLLRIPVIAGKRFDWEYYGKQDSCAIVNQSAKAMLNVEVGDMFTDDNGTKCKVIGEVDNFNFNTLQDKTPPLIVYSNPLNVRYMLIRFEKGKTTNGLTFAKKVWDELSPDYPFSPIFLSSSLKELYDGEKKLGSLVLFFTLLALVIATLGLYGLSTFLVSKRMREIGIRKVMGATERQIRTKISYDFLKWVLLSNILAWPLAYFLLENWLASYAFHISISPLFFIAGTAISAIAAFATIYWQISHAVKVNPAQTLKQE